MIYKMKKLKTIKNINQYRDFIHIDDVSRSIKCLIEKEVQKEVVDLCSSFPIYSD